MHLLQICHTVDSDAGQVSNCVEEKLADVFLMFPDYPAHNGGVKVEREKEEAFSLSRKSTASPEAALESREARYSMQALAQIREMG